MHNGKGQLTSVIILTSVGSDMGLCKKKDNKYLRLLVCGLISSIPPIAPVPLYF
jgi:hypothetical protein